MSSEGILSEAIEGEKSLNAFDRIASAPIFFAPSRLYVILVSRKDAKPQRPQREGLHLALANPGESR